MLTDSERLARVRRRRNIAWCRWIQAKVDRPVTSLDSVSHTYVARLQRVWCLLMGWEATLKELEVQVEVPF